MSPSCRYVFAVFAASASFHILSGLASHEEEQEHKKYQVYYDESWRPLPLLAMGNMTTAQHQRFPLRRYGIMPCDCMGLQCGCCVNTNFFSSKRSGCMNMTWDPDEFAIGMNMLWNGESVWQNSISAKNPPPACLEAPFPYIPSLQFCARLYDIYIPGRNIHMCVNFETRIARAPILVLEFDCFQMGWDGLDYLKPNSSTARPVIESPLAGLLPEGGSGGAGEESESEGPSSDDTQGNVSIGNVNQAESSTSAQESTPKVHDPASSEDLVSSVEVSTYPTKKADLDVKQQRPALIPI